MVLEAQEQQAARTGMNPGFRRRALVMDISARVLEGERVTVWTESETKTAFPGSPVNLRLVGSNIVIAMQFTPFLRRQGNVLVAQGQIWLEDSNGQVSYHTSLQTIPMELNEPIYFFPLGTSPQNNPIIEIMLTINPYRENPVAAENEEETN